MSCELKTLAAIDDLAAVRSSLKLDNGKQQTVFTQSKPKNQYLLFLVMPF